MIVCTKCQGNKSYRGIGHMMQKCEVCKGLGAVKKDEPDEKELQHAESLS